MLGQNGFIELKPDNRDPLFNDFITNDTYWGRLIGYEVLLSAFFTIIYLILRFETSMKKVDRIVKGIACSIVLSACLSMTNGAGESLNPALGFAQSIFMIGVENQSGSTQGSKDAKYIWVYMVFPYVGALFAAAFYRMHDYIEKNEYNQNQPMQFVGLLKQSDAAPLLPASRFEPPQHERSQVWQQLHNSNLPSEQRSESTHTIAMMNAPPVIPQSPPNLLEEDVMQNRINQTVTNESAPKETLLESRPTDER
jgi:hypothetical protein